MAERMLCIIVKQARQFVALDAAGSRSDRELLDQWVGRRDDAAFTTLVQRHAAMVLGVCRRVLKHGQDAEDASQATFLVLARTAASIRKRTALASWLYGVAYRLSRKMHTAQVRRRAREDRAGGARLCNPAADPSWREVHAALDEALMSLPEMYRAPLVLCYLEERTRDEAAQQLALTLSTLRGRLERGRDMARAGLARRGITLSGGLLLAALSAEAGRGAVPASFAAAVVRAAFGRSLGPAAARVALLADGAVKTIVPSKIGITLALLVLLGLGAGAGMIGQPSERADVAAPATPSVQLSPPEAAQPKEGERAKGCDLYGDPLPPGAVARLGSLRLLCADELANVVFTPDGRIVAAVLRYVRNANSPCQFWEVATGRAAPAPVDTRFIQEVSDRRRKQWQDASERLRKANPTLTDDDLQIGVESPDRALIATSSRRQRFRIWDGHTLKELPAWAGQTKEGTDSLAFSPDGKMLSATSARSTQVWDVGTGKLRHTLPGLGWQSFASTFSPDGKTLAVADGEVVTLWSLATGTPLHQFGHAWMVSALAFAPDGQSLISGASYTDRLIHRWNPRTGERLATWRGHTSAIYALAISRDGKRAISGSDDGSCRLWEVATGRELGWIGKHAKPIWSADLASDGRTAVTTENDLALLWPLDGTKPLRSFSHDGQRVMQVLFSPDGRHLLTRAEEKPGVVRIWHLGTGAEIRRLKSSLGATVSGFDLSRDGRQVAEEREGTIHLWDFETGRLTRTLTIAIGEMPGSTKWALSVFSPDGRCLAVGVSDGTVRLVEVATGQERLRWQGHKRGVTKVLFSPDGARLASGSWDRTILVWDVIGVPAMPPAELGPLWADLGDIGPTAFSAMRKLLSAGDAAVALIARHLRPAPAVDSKRITALIADLDSDLFVERQQAFLELERLGEAAETAMRNTLGGSPSAETRRRAEALLAKIAQPSGDHLQALRAVEVLERLATPAAKDALRTLAAGAADASKTKDAERSLRRLDRR